MKNILVRYIEFTLIGILILSGVIIVNYQIGDYQKQIVEDKKDKTKQLIENLVSRREVRIDTISSGIIGFYRGSQAIDVPEFKKFNEIFLANDSEIKGVFILQENKIIQSYPDERNIGYDFDSRFPGYPTNIDGINTMTVEFPVLNNLKLIIAVPFDYFIPVNYLPFDNYKLILHSPSADNLELFEIHKNQTTQQLHGITFSDDELRNSIHIEKHLQLYGYKLQKDYDLKYTIWSEFFETQNTFIEQIVLSSGVAVSVIIPLLLIRSARLSEVIRKYANTLEKANNELLQIDKSKEEFVSMVSHELKTPLVPITGYSEMLLNPQILGEISEKQKKAIQMIHKNAQKLDALINDVLDVQKLDMEKMTFSMKNVDIAELINQNVSELKLFALTKKVEIVSDIQITGMVYCDPKRIDQVISNLVKNSIDFVPEQDGKITIQAEKNIESEIIITVKDNGKGIPPDKADSLFQKFYQVDTSANRKHGGTGLGLIICKGIVEAHGGKIWLDKTYTKGAAFKFTLPVRKTL